MTATTRTRCRDQANPVPCQRGLDRVVKICVWSVSFDQVRVESIYTAFLLGSITHRKRTFVLF